MFVARSPRFTEEELREAIANSLSWAEALRQLSYRSAGGNWKTLKKYALLWGISTDHFDPDHARHRGFRNAKRPLEEIMVPDSSYSRAHLKQRLFDEGLKQRVCEACGQGEVWRGRRMALILDHINGTPNDHRLENLRILCPNCAATLDTHCGNKNRLPRSPRQCQRCGKDFIVKSSRQRYCSRECGSRWDRNGTVRGVPRPTERRVERPRFAQLLAEIERLGYSGTGRKYGVSDNAIRKWVRQYERERAIAEGRDPDVIEIPTRTWPNQRRAAA
jgi:hypothetical protein